MSILMYTAISFPWFFCRKRPHISIPSPLPQTKFHHLLTVFSMMPGPQKTQQVPNETRPPSCWNSTPLVPLPQKAYEQFSGFLSKAVIASQRAVYESHQGPTFRKKRIEPPKSSYKVADAIQSLHRKKHGICCFFEIDSRSGQISLRPHTTWAPKNVSEEGNSPYFREI